MAALGKFDRAQMRRDLKRVLREWAAGHDAIALARLGSDELPWIPTITTDIIAASSNTSVEDAAPRVIGLFRMLVLVSAVAPERLVPLSNSRPLKQFFALAILEDLDRTIIGELGIDAVFLKLIFDETVAIHAKTVAKSERQSARSGTPSQGPQMRSEKAAAWKTIARQMAEDYRREHPAADKERVVAHVHEKLRDIHGIDHTKSTLEKVLRRTRGRS